MIHVYTQIPMGGGRRVCQGGARPFWDARGCPPLILRLWSDRLNDCTILARRPRSVLIHNSFEIVQEVFGNLNRITLAVLFLFEVLQSSTAQYRKLQASLTFRFPHCTYVNESENYNEALLVL